MSEYELGELTAAVLANFLTALTVFLSIASAYVISAFSAGDRLTRIQLAIINVCFLMAVGMLGFLTISLYGRFFALAQSIEVKRGTIAAIDFSWPLCVLMLVMVVGCFAFMWNVRTTDEQ